MVPPGTAALAAAVALAAASPVSRVSVMPLAWWPPLDGSCAGGVAAVPALSLLSVALVEVDVDDGVCALAGVMSAAPTATPVSVEPASTAPMAAFLRGLRVLDMRGAPW